LRLAGDEGEEHGGFVGKTHRLPHSGFARVESRPQQHKGHAPQRARATEKARHTAVVIPVQLNDHICLIE